MSDEKTVVPQTENSGGKKSDSVKGLAAVNLLLQRDAEAVAQPESAANATKVEGKTEAGKIAEPAAPSPEDAKATEPKQDEAKPQGDADSDDALSQLPTDVQEKINKRIAKEIAKTKAMREGYEAELARLKSQPPIQVEAVKADPTPDNPLANITDIPGLVKAQREAKEAKRWAEAQLDRDDLDKGVQMNGQTITKGDLKAIVRNAEVMLEDHIPQRAQFLNTRSQAEKIAAETFPWFNDRNSVERQMYDAAFKTPQYAFLATLPDAPITVAKQVMGEMALRQLVAQKKTGPIKTEPDKPKAPNSQAGGSGASGPSRTPSTDQVTKELEQAMKEARGKRGIKGRDATALLARMETIRLTR